MSETKSRFHDMRIAVLASLSTLLVIAAIGCCVFLSTSQAQASVTLTSYDDVAQKAVQTTSEMAVSTQAAAAQMEPDADLASQQAYSTGAEGQYPEDTVGKQGSYTPQSPNSTGTYDASGANNPPAINNNCPAYPQGGCPAGGTYGGCRHGECGYCYSTGHNSSVCPYNNTCYQNGNPNCPNGNNGWGRHHGAHHN